MKRFFVTIYLFFCLVAGVAAQKFFNLTASEVRIDSLLPVFTYQHDLGLNYADSTYSVSIEYPEFIDMSPTDVARLKSIGGEDLPAMPAISQSIGVERKNGWLDISFVPLVKRDGRYQKLVSFMLRVKTQAKQQDGASARVQSLAGSRFQASSASSRYASNSVLANGRWVKISVDNTGIYQLTSQFIRNAGFSDLSKVKVYGYGGALQPESLTGDYLQSTDDLKELPTCVSGGRKLFFAVGPVNWASATTKQRVRNNYSEKGYYFLTEDGTAPATIDEATFTAQYANHPNNYHSIVEPEEYSWYHGGRNLFGKATLGSSPLVYTIDAPVSSAKMSVAFTYNGYCSVDVLVNGVKVGNLDVSAATVAAKTVNFPNSGQPDYASMAETTWEFDVTNLNVGENTVTLKRASNALTSMRLDNIILTFTEPKSLGSLSSTGYPEPTKVEVVANQNLHADGQTDMVIIIPTSLKLLAQAERLKALHEQKDGLRVRIVAANQLYNEFSSGTPDASAYRRYMKMLYDRAGNNLDDMPKYLLLLGDGAWDNRMLTSEWKGVSPDDFLLCYESEESFSVVYCYVSDDFYCLLDDEEVISKYTGKPDVAVGRIPARTADEAKIAVDKIVDYRNNVNAGSWQNLVCMMGDDGDGNQHMDAAEAVSKVISKEHPSMNIKKIYWDAYTRQASSTGLSYPDVTRIVKQQMRDGALIMNYNGHGSSYCLSHEMTLKLADFGEATSMRLPLWFTASCDVTPFDGQGENIGEKALFNKKGGAIAFIGTTRTVWMGQNRTMNLVLMSELLKTNDKGQIVPMGEAFRQTKVKLVEGPLKDWSVNKLNYVLLGDPALALAAPTLEAVVDSINGEQVQTGAKTQLKAGARVTVSGYVKGQSNYNGVATIVVRDVEEEITCKGNSTDDVFVFKDRPSTIYTGSDSVRNGRFTFTFAIPRDITYSQDAGQIIVYTVNNEKTLMANGIDESFAMYGTADTGNTGIGPSIFCYLNKRSFKNGDTVNSTPYFYAELADDDGLNAVGSGIGHDIELIVDGDMSKTYVLNSYFQYDFGDYCKGTIGFSIPELEEGEHKLMLRAWDVLNNSSKAEINFVVDPKLTPELMNIICVRNPASTNTRFLITHDRIGSQMDFVLEIFDTSGRILWRRSETGVPTDQTYAIDWDLTTSSGSRLRTGVYLYRVLISSNGSSQASAAQKLIVIDNK